MKTLTFCDIFVALQSFLKEKQETKREKKKKKK